MERSILLDDSSPDSPRRMGPGRWANALAIAAIVLLCISLGIIVYKTVLPTFKPPTFTQVVVSEPPGGAAEKSMEPQAPGMNQNGSSVAAIDQVNFGMAAGRNAQPPNLPGNSIPPVAFDMEAVRRRLEGSGYNLPVIATGREAQAPVVLVIDSVNPSTTHDHIARFLNSKSGVAWKMIPPSSGLMLAGDAASFAIAATRPSTTRPDPDVAASAAPVEQMVTAPPATQPSPAALVETGNSQPQGNSPQASAALADNNSANGSGIPATQPSSDVYVATGVTREVAEELRDALVNQQFGVAAQVYDSSGVAQAATQPAASQTVLQRDLSDSASTTRPSDHLLALPPQMAERADGAATQPSPPIAPMAGGAIAPGTNTFSASNSNILQNDRIAGNALGSSSTGSVLMEKSVAQGTVDAVIVVQIAAASGPMVNFPQIEPTGGAASTRPSPMVAPATQP